jgi:hypothetical protein
MDTMPFKNSALVVVSGLTGASLGIAVLLEIHPFDTVPSPELPLFLLVAAVAFVAGVVLAAAASAYLTDAENRTKNVRGLSVVLAPLILSSWGQVHGFRYGIDRLCPAEAEGRVIGVPSDTESNFDFKYRFVAGDAEFDGGGRGARPNVGTSVLIRYDPSRRSYSYGVVADRPDVGLPWQIASVALAFFVGAYWNRFRRGPIVVCLILCAVALTSGLGRGNAVAGFDAMRNHVENQRLNAA